MPKVSYKIPHSINQGALDMEIAVKNKDGVGIKPTPVRVYLAGLLAFVVGVVVLTNTPVGSNGFFITFLFLLFYIPLSVLLISFGKTKEMKFGLVPVLIEYIPKSARYIFTRRSSNALPFYYLFGIDEITDNGLIVFNDDSYGFAYRVVGSASVLLFETDRDAILKRCDAFYRKLTPDFEPIFITTKEPQVVVKQVEHVRSFRKNIPHDSELSALIDEREYILTNYIGKDFKSIHQYLILKAKNKEALRIAHNILQQEVENSSLIFKRCTSLFEEEITDVLGSIYKGLEE